MKFTCRLRAHRDQQTASFGLRRGISRRLSCSHETKVGPERALVATSDRETQNAGRVLCVSASEGYLTEFLACLIAIGRLLKRAGSDCRLFGAVCPRASLCWQRLGRREDTTKEWDTPELKLEHSSLSLNSTQLGNSWSSKLMARFGAQLKTDRQNEELCVLLFILNTIQSVCVLCLDQNAKSPSFWRGSSLERHSARSQRIKQDGSFSLQKLALVLW